MGLEGLEIVLATEETFGIAMSDAVAAAIQTPAELIEFIATNVPIATSQECLTQQLFYRLRRGFRSQVPPMMEKFDLDTELAGILHKNQWNEVWLAIRATSGDSSWPESVPWPGFFRDGPKTIRQLIWDLVASLPRPTQGESWSRVKIEAEVRRIIAEVLDKKDFDLSAKFIGELGVQ